MKKRVLTVFLLAVLCCLFCFSSAGSVKAHAEGVTLQSTGYDLHPLSGFLNLNVYNGSASVGWDADPPPVGNIYQFDNVSYTSIDQITFSAMTPNSQGFDVLFNQSLYDYYFVVTVFADVSNNEEFTFYPDYMSYQTYPCDFGSKWYAFLNLSTKHFDTPYSRGFTIIGKMQSTTTSSRLTQISMRNRDNSSGYTLPANVKFACSVVETPKNSVTSADIQSIIGKIDEQTDVISGGIEAAADKIADQIENQYEYSEDDDLGVGSIIEEYEEKVGLLTFASDTFIGVLDLFSPSNAGEPEIIVPAWSMNIQGTNYQVWDEYRFNLKFVDESLPYLMKSVRLVTVSLFYLGILKYIHRLYERWFLAQ